MKTRPTAPAKVIGLVAVLSSSLLVQAAPASAHHSYAAFDRSKTITLTGTVKAWEWTNPHTWLTITVADPKKTGQAKVQDWAFEGLAPGTLRPKGWSRQMLKPGDKVVVTLNPRRDGTVGGTLVNLTLPGGKVMS